MRFSSKGFSPVLIPNQVLQNVEAISYLGNEIVRTMKMTDTKDEFWQPHAIRMGRWGRPPELEGIVIFLASPASDFITGQTIYIDGGWTVW